MEGQPYGKARQCGDAREVRYQMPRCGCLPQRQSVVTAIHTRDEITNSKLFPLPYLPVVSFVRSTNYFGIKYLPLRFLRSLQSNTTLPVPPRFLVPDLLRHSLSYEPASASAPIDKHLKLAGYRNLQRALRPLE